MCLHVCRARLFWGDIKYLDNVMGYIIEIAFDIRLHRQVESYKSYLESIALDCHCTELYFLYEIEGNRSITRNHCILVTTFDEESLVNVARYIRNVKKLAIIESVSKNNILLYASARYLMQINKQQVKEYRERIKENDSILKLL